MKRYQYSTIALCVLLATGCVARSELPEQNVTVPEQWQTGQTQSETQAISQWWTSFGDPQLNQWVEKVLATNSDLAIATLTLKQARLEAGLATSDTYPDVSASVSGERSKPLDGGDSSKSYQASLSVSYELDLWGKLSAAKDAAMWTALATQQEREATAQSLVATTAQLYWQIGYLNQRVELSNNDINDAKETLALTQSQYRHGSVTRVNVLEAERTLAGLEATHRDYLQQRTEAVNAFAILFDQPPQDLATSIPALPDYAVPTIEAGVPADVLNRRPDVKQSLFELKSVLATKDNTDTNYFPSLTLTGALGGSSTELRKLLSDPIGTLGADLTLPFLNWNEMQLNRDIAQVKYESAIISYRKTLYAALQDVDNALSAKENYEFQAEKLQKQYDSAAEVARIYKSQYEYGAIDITTLLDAQENERSAKASLLENSYNQLVNIATVYQSLGGEDIVRD
ncbi:efflux transporter outer membrane subunit [Vibrio fluvialis]|uniref:efflux transporter outer membrane subunit n=1 Tax=Vibrio sp. bablab_jr001 TaxID=2755067 RepID=UPI0018F205E1|nr:efflux transporter outer membrane subunit [Vibrio sp. bablab_jr001]EKO3397489.1 efflux transporter outer membrane subunit [Vibrio fluvialis]EKO3473223.1 efflux transporter outer membrane subunit [Vibrio fluvialis]MBY8114434.1 efflux transporter outer membrane subunit [Vibrio fluvialis]MBY8246896.1 efflux transporter outer membrane subunit [Vibrio fluvialis]MBY8280551.1 efflux transporter outer membrane subunit [Vibrio fluvialis]